MDNAMRATYRGQVTKIANGASEYLKSAEAQINESNVDRLEEVEADLTVYLERLSAAHQSLTKHNNAVQEGLKPEDLKKECDTIAEYEDKATSTMARLRLRLLKLREFQSRILNISSSNNQRPNNVQGSAAKLPKLSLRSFSGEFKEWLPFWEGFRVAVHERPDLNGAEKFNYLQLHLTGKAASTVAGFIPSDENYHAAISLLQEEYGNNEKLIDHIMQQLMSLPHVSSRRDVLGLRRLYNSVTTSTRSLTALGIPSQQYSVMLKTLLLRCLPDEIVVEFYRRHQQSSISDHTEKNFTETTSLAGSEISSIGYNGDNQVREILKYLKSEVESLERSAQTHNKRPLTQNSQRVRTAAGLLSSNETQMCCFCKSETHTSQRCNTSLPISKREEILKADGRCFRCLRKGHNSRECKNKFIRCDKCQGRHSSPMCDPTYQSTVTSRAQITDRDLTKNSDALPTTSLCSSSQSSSVYLQTATVLVANAVAQKMTLTVRVVLDGGSQRTYVTQNMVTKLGLKVFDKVKMRILPFGCTARAPAKKLDRVKIVLKSRYNEQCVSILAVVVPNICIDVLPIPSAQCPVFSNLELADSGESNENGLNILIGADYYWEIVNDKSKRLTPNLMAIETIFGWTIQGPASNSCSSNNLNLSILSTTLSVNAFDDAQLERFWDLESIGITLTETKKSDINIDNYVTKTGDRYEASLLWRTDKIALSDNYNCAFIRLNKLIRNLLKSESKLMEYDAAMRELITAGIAERVNESSGAERIFYMPHHPVYREDKSTTPIRIVFDASAHSGNDLSLNQNLSAGPNLLPDVLTILLNFRLGKIGLVADIEKAFHQISLVAEDRDVHRFLWFRDKVTNTKHLPPLVVYRMTRVTFGVVCSPYLLCATLNKHFVQETGSFPGTCELLKRSFYMDDFVSSVDDAKIADAVYRESCEILKRASMHIRKWNSNSVQLRMAFKGNSPDLQKALGLLWSCHNDELSVDLQRLHTSVHAAPTKRNVLGTIARIFDPYGLLSPVVVKLKLLFQELWRLRLDWDEPLPHRFQTIWNTFWRQLPLLDEVSIPRCVFISPNRTRQELHVFTDASMAAYGAVAYVRSIDEVGSIYVMYLCSKNRIAPLKGKNSTELTLPKLELTAAVIGARLMKFLSCELATKFDAIYMWSDSKITLQWIYSGNQHKQKPYIANRVEEIIRLTSAANWRHCPGNENPADMLTRGISGSILVNTTIWITGPHWLSLSPDNWPQHKINSENYTPLLSLQVATEIEKINEIEPLFALENFSQYQKVLRITAYVFRFIDSLQRKRRPQKFLIGEEIRRAETYWIKHVQFQKFSPEIAALRDGNLLSRSSSILTLNPMIDEEQILRIRTRLQESEFEYNEVYPVLLPKSSHFTILLVQDTHERTLHGGINVVLTRLRERFWIIKARQLTNGIIKRCKVCLRLKGPPASQPIAPLPKQRLHSARPFETTGVDFMGPLYVRRSNDISDTSKVYVMVLTCAVLRAIHLELVPDLTAESCLLALRRFFARRGVPKCILSDNARTFKRASLELRHLYPLFESEKLQGFISNNGISWNFIVKRAAWWGGFWERLVKVVKDLLKATIGRDVLTMEQLQTFLVEAEGVINSRPLTYVSEDPEDLSPLTPNHFLKGPSTAIVSSSCSSETNDKDIRSRWKTRLRLYNIFKKRFTTEYIKQLRSAHHYKQQFSTDIQPGDVIILYDQSTARLFWKLAVITKVFPGRDGKVRSCELRVSNGSILRRPIQHLYPLEMQSKLERGSAGGC